MPASNPAPWRARLDAALAAARDRPDARWAQLATIAADGAPANRTVVVRNVPHFEERLVLTTDRRSAKVEDLIRDPRAELCWNLPATREQFRIRGRLRQVGPEAPADSAETAARTHAWHDASPASRQTFTWPDPGEPRADPSAFVQPVPADPPAVFTLLILDPEQVDHLDLRPTPHERVRFRWEKAGWIEVRVNP